MSQVNIEYLSREKYWDERTQEEKLEKLAQAVEFLSITTRSLETSVEFLKCHEHTPSGRLLVPIGLPIGPEGFYRSNILNREQKIR